MQVPKDAVLLRISFGESDRFRGQPLLEAIVSKAREILFWRGSMGFVYEPPSAKVLGRLMASLPV